MAGDFIVALTDFIIIALVIFMIVRTEVKKKAVKPMRAN